MDVVALACPRLPDPVVGLGPCCRDVVDDLTKSSPPTSTEGATPTLVDVGCIHQRARSIELDLIARAVADANRLRAVVPGQVMERSLVGDPASIDGIHDLELPIALERIADEVKELAGLTSTAEQIRGANRHRGISRPRIPIVPVSMTSKPFGDRRGWSSNHRTGRRIHQQFQEQAGANDMMAPRTVVSKSTHPITPALSSSAQRIERSVREHGLRLRRVPANHHPNALARLELED